MLKITGYSSKSIEVNVFILTLLAFICVISLTYNQSAVVVQLNEQDKLFISNNYNFHVLQNNSIQNSTESMSMCSINQSELKGLIELNLTKISDDELLRHYAKQNIKYGGKWEPKTCKQIDNHVAIIIPYRDRKEHLNSFLLNMLPIFMRQKISFGIYLIEPVASLKFNRGLLLNIGFIESNKDTNNLWKCHAFHDVDLLTENDYTLYNCPNSPTHLSHRINKFNYSIMRNTSFGGVTIVKKEHFIHVNGYSNLYFGWGGEDNDHQKRFSAKGYEIATPAPDFNRYFMHKHKSDEPNIDRYEILTNSELRFETEGLNSLKYKVVEKIVTPFFVKIKVIYNQNELFKEHYINKRRARKFIL